MSDPKVDPQKSGSDKYLDRIYAADEVDVSAYCQVLWDMLMTAQIPMTRAEEYADIKRWLESMING